MVAYLGNDPRTPALSRRCSTTELIGYIEFVSSCPIVIATIHPCNKLERDSVRHLGYLTSTVSFADLRSSPRVGVEPINLLLYQSFEETSIACCSLADTYKTWYRHMESNHNSHVRSVVYYPLYYSDKFGRGYWDRTSDDRVKVCSVTATLTPNNKTGCLFFN